MKAKKNLPAPISLRQIFLPAIVALFGMLFCLFDNAAAQTAVGSIKSAEIDSPGLRSEKKSGLLRELPYRHLQQAVQPEESKIIRLPKPGEPQAINTGFDKPIQIGTIRPLENSIGKASQGSNFSLADGRVWTVGVVSETAVQTRLHFANLNLPPGAKLFIYSMSNPDEFYNLTTRSGNFWTQPIEGEGIVIEYFNSAENDLTGRKLPFEISEISHIYHNPLRDCQSGSLLPPQLPCHNDIPLDWDELARASALIQFTLPNGEFLCTGTLLNSLVQDFNPVMLTANHCFNTQSAAQSLRVYWFYFEGDTPSPELPRSDGATLLTTGAANDYTLVNVLGSVPNILGMVYSGWDSAITPVGTQVLGLHYPQASHIRYSSGTTISGYCPSLPSACQNFTGVAWNSGAIESGSNGSGLWKGADLASSRLVGTLTNGLIACSNGRGSYSSFSSIYPNISPHMQGGNDDLFDNGGGNDTRASAVALQPGNYSNLVVKWLDEDWYAISVPAGYRITATANFTHSYGDIDLEIYRGNETVPVAFSYSVTNSETVQHTAVGASTYYLAAYFFDGARNNYNLNISLQQVAAANRRAFDFDGDGKTDISTFRPSNGSWYISNSGSGGSLTALQFGVNGDLIAPSDFDGDGKTDICVFRPSNGSWYRLNSSNNTFYGIQFGANGDLPASGDFDGDGRADITVYRPSAGSWYRLNSSNGQFVGTQFGIFEDRPIVGDFDGDGKNDLTVFRPSNGSWYRLNSSNGQFVGAQFGANGDKPVAADYDGDGKTDLAVYRASNGYWYVIQSINGAFIATQFGISEDKPAPADFDGDGKADRVVFRPSNGTWYLLRTTAGFTGAQFGTNGDVPTPNAFVR